MVAFQYRMDAGYPGAINRAHDATIQAEVMDNTGVPATYGLMLTMGTNGVRAPVASDTAAMFSGLYVRPYPTAGGSVSNAVNDPLSVSTPPGIGHANVMKRGYMAVKLNAASPAVVKGQAVGIFIGTASAGNPAGGVTGAAPGATVLAIPAKFVGPADANGITEIEYNL